MPECTWDLCPRYSVLSKETLDRIRKRMSFFRQFLGCGNSMQRSPVRFTLTSSCKQIQLKAWRVDWDGLPPDRSLCTGAPWETEIVLPRCDRCDSSVWLNACCHIRYLSSFRKRSWPIGVEHSTGIDLQTLSEQTLRNEARQHHRLMMEESLMKGHFFRILKQQRVSERCWWNFFNHFQWLKPCSHIFHEASISWVTWQQCVNFVWWSCRLLLGGRCRKCEGVIWGYGDL